MRLSNHTFSMNNGGGNIWCLDSFLSVFTVISLPDDDRGGLAVGNHPWCGILFRIGRGLVGDTESEAFNVAYGQARCWLCVKITLRLNCIVESLHYLVLGVMGVMTINAWLAVIT